MNLTRRELCIAAATGAAALATPVRLFAQASIQSGTWDAIVLGAGVSGLNSARLLEEQGLRVLILEGRSRVGGRVLTLFDQPGLPEMGFASMGAGYGRSIDAAKRLGLELVDVGPRFMNGFKQELVLRRQFVTREEWAKSPQNPFPDARKSLMPWELSGKLITEANPLREAAQWLEPNSATLDVSMHEFLSKQGLNDAAIRLAYDASPYFGSSAFDVSALMLEFSDAWNKSQRELGPQSFMVKGGNQKLPMAMAAALKGDLLFGKEVIGISTQSDGATASCADGSTYRAKRIICSLPFSTLRDIKIEPNLTGVQHEAVSTLAYQPICIAFLTVKSHFWEKDHHSPSFWTDGPLGSVLALQLGAQEGEVTGLMLQARGELARYWDRLGKNDLSRLILSEFEAIRPAAKGEVRVSAIHSWGQERYNAGDWAYFGPGEVSRFLTTMAAPSGRLHFCGEHTARSNRGLEAAFESSERAALEVLSA